MSAGTAQKSGHPRTDYCGGKQDKITQASGGCQMGAEADELTQLLLDWSSGEKAALDQIIPLVYAELRRLAAGYLRRERPDHTLQTTALVHEAYLRLIDQSRVNSQTRAQFFGIAANLMRQILVNHAEARRAAKRGGGNKVALEKVSVLMEQPGIDVIALNHAICRLFELDPRQGQIVELRFFGGLTEQEIGGFLGVSEMTVRREWRTAKAVLHHELRHGEFE